jgi:hypothetical protein
MEVLSEGTMAIYIKNMYTYFPHPKNGEEQFIDLRLEQESYIL